MSALEVLLGDVARRDVLDLKNNTVRQANLDALRDKFRNRVRTLGEATTQPEVAFDPTGEVATLPEAAIEQVEVAGE